jgi:DMSO/TMAO reductase YedYZ molybdopterin-dependent catalytic subunit
MDTIELSRKQRFWVGFAAGLAAGVIATGVMLWLSVGSEGISLPEVFGSKLTALMPPPIFDFLHRLIGGDAKHYLFYGILAGQCLVFALSGALYSVVASRRSPSEKTPHRGHLQWYDGLRLALILWAATGLLLLPLTGAGIFGSALIIGPLNSILSLAEVGAIFGLVFVLLQNLFIDRFPTRQERVDAADEDEVKPLSRRDVLKGGAIVVGVGILGAGIWHFITQSVGPSPVPVARLVQQFKQKIVPAPIPNYGEIHPAPFLSPEVTPNDQYYIVSKNLFSDPTVDAGPWRLTVTGHVQHSFTLTYDDILKMPMKEQYESMMCVSNEVGGEYMSNALWEGFPLADLLNRAGVDAGATKVVLYAVDDYSDSIHIDKAMEPTTLLAVRMNGKTLPQGHGFPLRLLVPGIYGMKHVKWITRIEVVNSDYQGYWQERGWSDAAPIRLTSRIDTPLTSSTVHANTITYIAGVAFSGNRGISEVDVSLDAGQTWQRATLKQPLSNLTWVLWELAWQPKPGDYTVIVRAIDLEGNVQDPDIEPPLPNGSSGYHTIYPTVI